MNTTARDRFHGRAGGFFQARRPYQYPWRAELQLGKRLRVEPEEVAQDGDDGSPPRGLNRLG